MMLVNVTSDCTFSSGWHVACDIRLCEMSFTLVMKYKSQSSSTVTIDGMSMVSVFFINFVIVVFLQIIRYC